MSKQSIGKLVVRSTAVDSALLDHAYHSLTALKSAGTRSVRVGVEAPRGVVHLDATLKGIQEAKAKLKDVEVALNPYMNPLPLVPLYDKNKIEVPPVIQVEQARFDFYVVPLGAKLFVTNGAVSNLRLEVALDTKPKGGGQLAIAQTLFPKTEYKVYASANITAGLNASLGFDVPLKPNGQPWITTAQLSADIKGGFVFGPFEYSFKKCAVMGAGEGASTVDWKITKSDLLDGGSFHAWLVLKVPKGRKSIWVTARMETTLTIPHFPFPIHKMLPSDDKDYELALV